jgi:uncharacterized LabA/DUF88 family protein
MRARIFIDFWNFQLNWKDRMDPKRCDWRALPPALIGEAQQLLDQTGATDQLVLEETLLYASVDPTGAEAKLRGWLTGVIERMPSYRVKIRERRPQRRTIHCRACGNDLEKCPKCAEAYTWRPEKGVDAAIVTDLLSLAHQDSWDVAVLLSSDADFIPAVEYLQGTGLKVINASWAGYGYDLKGKCWASFDLDAMARTICR